MINQKKKTNTLLPFKNILELEKGTQNLSFGKEKVDLEKEPKIQPQQRKEFTVFSYSQYYEQELVKKKINELLDLIKQEIQVIKKTEKSLLSEVKDIENLTIESLPKKSGIYHIRFLETILSLLRNIRKKVSESKTWLEALMTKKKERGSLFLIRAKKRGTQYSLSQELQVSRAVQ
jgi:tRNA(Ser,Leu) C12 N-acetylase TAN1